MAKSRATTRSTLPSIDGDRLVEGDRGDRRRGVGADAGKRRKPVSGFGKARARQRRDGAGAFDELARAASSSRAPPRRP